MCLGALMAAGSGATTLSGSFGLKAPAPHGGFNGVGLNGTTCKQDRTSAKNYGSSVTINFPVDCGATGSITVPSVKMSGSSDSFGQFTHVCVSPTPIAVHGHSCPYPSVNPQGLCTQASSTFWYLMTHFNAVRLNGYGSWHVKFNSNTFPIVFSSSTFIVPGYTYGLCVLSTSGSVIQDDFANGNGAAPSGNTINVNMVLKKHYLHYNYDETVDLYLESRPASLLNRSL